MKQYNTSQQREIQYGIDDGLTNIQIDVYRSPEFTEEQMEAIRVRLTDGASTERMKQFCSPTISANVIRIIGWALMNDFTNEEIGLIISSDSSYDIYEDLLVGKGK